MGVKSVRCGNFISMELSEWLELLQMLPASEERASIRRVRGVTQRQLAREVGCSPATLLRWERGESLPRPRHLRKYLAALTLLMGEGDGHDRP